MLQRAVILSVLSLGYAVSTMQAMLPRTIGLRTRNGSTVIPVRYNPYSAYKFLQMRLHATQPPSSSWWTGNPLHTIKNYFRPISTHGVVQKVDLASTSLEQLTISELEQELDSIQRDIEKIKHSRGYIATWQLATKESRKSSIKQELDKRIKKEIRHLTPVIHSLTTSELEAALNNVQLNIERFKNMNSYTATQLLAGLKGIQYRIEQEQHERIEEEIRLNEFVTPVEKLTTVALEQELAIIQDNLKKLYGIKSRDYNTLLLHKKRMKKINKELRKRNKDYHDTQ